MKTFRAALLLALCPLAAFGQVAPPSPFGEQVEVNIVNVEVFVTDKDGKPVSGLERGDFEVREDGKPMEVTNFEAFRGAAPEAPAAAAIEKQEEKAAPKLVAEPLHLVVYIDNGFLLPAHRNRVLQQLRGFLGQLRTEDEVMLVTADPGLHIRLPFSRDRAALARTVDEIEKLAALGMSNASAKRLALDQILTIHEIENCPASIAQPAKTYAVEARNDVLRSLGAMTVLVNSLSGIPGRKALLLVSDGMPVTPGEEVFQVLAELCSGASDSEGKGVSEYTPREAALDAQQSSAVNAFSAFTAHANAQRVTLYTLQASGLQGLASASADFSPNERVLQLQSVASVESANLQNSLFVLASDTGGRAILDANDVSHDLTRMQEDFSTYYSLAYSPAHAGDGRQHRIDVRVKRPGLRLRFRQSYRDKPSLERAVDRTLASLYYGYQDNPLEIEMSVGGSEPAAKGVWTVPIRLRIPLFKLTLLPTTASYEGKLRVLVATDAAGKRSPVRQVDVPIHIPQEKAINALGQYYVYEVKLTLEPGEQHVAVAVRDEATTTTSFFARTLQVGTAARETKDTHSGSPAF